MRLSSRLTLWSLAASVLLVSGIWPASSIAARIPDALFDVYFPAVTVVLLVLPSVHAVNGVLFFFLMLLQTFLVVFGCAIAAAFAYRRTRSGTS